MIAGARVEVAPYKKNPADFVLWKPAPENELDSAFESPWGKGRPGWHIECSAMSKDCLGEEFDIHGGGADLMFPHHENEIAQSYCANGKEKFARYWVHNGFLTIDGEKMSKSLGNFKTVREALEEGIEGVVIRYLYLTTHYRKPLDWNEKAIHDAKKSIEKFRIAIGDIKSIVPREVTGEYYNTTDVQPWHDELMASLCDDLNTPSALAKLHVYVQRINKGELQFRDDLLKGCELLGLDLAIEKAQKINPEVIALAEQRKAAKLAKQWEKADMLRKQIHELGYEVNDLANHDYKLIKL
jgi:cysteinyl-tRNA synthetase